MGRLSWDRLAEVGGRGSVLCLPAPPPRTVSASHTSRHSIAPNLPVHLSRAFVLYCSIHPGWGARWCPHSRLAAAAAATAALPVARLALVLPLCGSPLRPPASLPPPQSQTNLPSSGLPPPHHAFGASWGRRERGLLRLRGTAPSRAALIDRAARWEWRRGMKSFYLRLQMLCRQPSGRGRKDA